MTGKTMVNENFCQSCTQKDTCRDTYEKIGDAKGPSVIWRVLIAFLLPIMVFIASLAAFEKISAQLINTKELRTIASFALALVVTFLLILITKAVNKHLGKDKPDNNQTID